MKIKKLISKSQIKEFSILCSLFIISFIISFLIFQIWDYKLIHENENAFITFKPEFMILNEKEKNESNKIIFETTNNAFNWIEKNDKYYEVGLKLIRLNELDN